MKGFTTLKIFQNNLQILGCLFTTQPLGIIEAISQNTFPKVQLEVLVLVSGSQLYHPQGSMTLLDFSPPLVSTKLYNSFFVQRHLLMPNAPESHVAFSPPFVVLIFLRWMYPCNNHPAPSLTVLNDIRRSGLSGASGQWRININKYKQLWLCTCNPL